MPIEAKSRMMTFENYLTYDDGTGSRYEWVDGVLIEMPTESESNAWLSFALQLYFINAGLIKPRLTHRYSCELEVPVLKPKQARNRFPDLVILRPEHIELTQKRLTIRLDMPPPVLVVEVVSLGKVNRECNYEEKRGQYEARGIPECWLIAPEQQVVMLMTLENGLYREISFRDSDRIVSSTFPDFALTVEQVLNPPE